MTSRLPAHVDKRDTILGRWVPIAFYGLNVFLWFLTGIAFSAGDRLWLAILALPAVAAYIWKITWNRTSR